MKRYIRPVDDDSAMYNAKYMIEIVFNYGLKDENIAASDRVKQSISIKKLILEQRR